MVVKLAYKEDLKDGSPPLDDMHRTSRGDDMPSLRLG